MSAIPDLYQFPSDYQDLAQTGSYAGGHPLLTGDTCEGILRNPAGSRMLALNDEFLLGIRDTLITEFGPAAAPLLNAWGKRLGHLAATEFEAELSVHYGRPPGTWSTALFHAQLIDHIANHGWGLATIDLRDEAHGIISITIANPLLSSLLPEHGLVEDLLSGYLAGFYSHFAAQDLDALQIASAPTAIIVLSLAKRLNALPPLIEQKKSPEDLLTALRATTA